MDPNASYAVMPEFALLMLNQEHYSQFRSDLAKQIEVMIVVRTLDLTRGFYNVCSGCVMLGV